MSGSSLDSEVEAENERTELDAEVEQKIKGRVTIHLTFSIWLRA
jgi:hypothetical protein